MKAYPDGGVYILKLKLADKKEIGVGALGKKIFKAGYYFYAGTAQRNLEARINRHYSSDKKFHWHIDYLLAEAELKKDFVFKLPGAGECFLAEILKEEGGSTPIKGFGASDCSCGTHLIYFSAAAGSKIVEELIKDRNLEKEFNEFSK
ncbi:MAG: GIY-YIG nuclease family protein [Halanaerobium sp.]